MHLGLTYSATCQIYWVVWDFPVLSPDGDIILSFTPPQKKGLIKPSKIVSVKCNEVQLDRFGWGKVRYLNYYSKFQIIYGWLGCNNKMKHPGSV